MARASPLKVYVTPAGFHDAVVAASSQKAALEAWGAHSNLFGEKLACLETDEAWKTKAMARPGEVLRKPRGDTAALMATPAPARAPAPAKATKAEVEPAPPAASRKARVAKLKPPPDRSKVDAAEAALAAAQTRLVDTQDDFSRRRDELEAAEARAIGEVEAEITKAQAQRTTAQAAFEKASAQVEAFNAANQSA